MHILYIIDLFAMRAHCKKQISAYIYHEWFIFFFTYDKQLMHTHRTYTCARTRFHTTWTLGQNAKELEECDPLTLACRLPHGDRTLGWCASEEEARIAPVSSNGRQALFVNCSHMTHWEPAVPMYMHRATGDGNICTHVQRLGGGRWGETLKKVACFEIGAFVFSHPTLR